MAERVTVFVSYSHQDAAWLARLQVHLRPLGDRLDLWDDTRLAAGDDWHGQITGAINRARVAVLLVSADFLASDFVTREELPRLLGKAREEGALIIPVIVKPCRFLRHPELATFQAANSPAAPLSGLPETESERVFMRISERIEEALDTEPGPGSHPAAPVADADALFPWLRSATLCLHVLSHLAGAGQHRECSVSELYDTLGATSRKGLVEALRVLQQAGWIERRRTEDHTVWSTTPAGERQLLRLAALTRAPLRVPGSDSGGTASSGFTS